MKKGLFFVLLAAVMLMGVSCNDNNENTGNLSVRLTDAPFRADLVAEATVTIDKVEARQSDKEEGKPFVTLTEEELSFNLLDLTNGLTANIVDVEVPAGSYNLFRLYVKSASIKLKDGRTFNMKVPSGASSGLKVFVKPEIVVSGGLSAELLLDFDVSRSFVPTGDISSPDFNGEFNFKPVIKASNVSVSGRIAGKVTDLEENPIESAQILLIVADTVNTTTFTDESGYYALLGLDPQTYKVKVEAESFVFQAVDNVEVNVANVTIQDFVLEPEAE